MNRTQLDELEISFWGRVIKSRRKLIAVITVLFTAVAVVAVLLAGTVHTARTEIFVSGTELAPEVQFVQSEHVAGAVEAALGFEPDVSVSASDTEFIITIEADARTAEEAARIVDTYAATYVTLRERAADEAWRATVAELERAVAQTQQELALVPPGDPEGKIQRLEREFTAYQDALAAAANGSFAEERGRPVVLAQATVLPVAGLVGVLLFGLAAAVVGLVSGIGVAAISVALHRGVGDPHPAAQALRAPLLGVIPSARKLLYGPPKGLRRRRAALGADRLLAGPGSTLADAVGVVRARLRPQDKEKLRGTVQVCSVSGVDPMDAAALALNLARSCARSGDTCVLVWADYRQRADVLAVLGVDAGGRGLAEAIEDRDLERSRRPVAELANLAVITPGAPPASVVDVLSGRGFRKLMTELADTVDVVVVYTPPLGEHVDGQLVGQAVDATVVVVTAATRHADLERAEQDMRDAGADIDGVVFVDAASTS